MPNDIRTRITTKNKLGYDVFRNPENINLKNEYKQKWNRLISDLRKMEIEYYSNELELNKSDIKKHGRFEEILLKKILTRKQKICFLSIIK